MLSDSILVVGTSYKIPITRAILKAGYVKRPVTDEAAAEALLNKADHLTVRFAPS